MGGIINKTSANRLPQIFNRQYSIFNWSKLTVDTKYAIDKQEAVADTSKVSTPPEHWLDLKSADRDKLCKRTGAEKDGAGRFSLQFLNKKHWRLK